MNKNMCESGEGNHNPLTIPMEMEMEMEISKLQTILEVMLVEILARLPSRSIAKFKSVCKTWKSLIESPYFRRLFVSVHGNSPSSWSLTIRNNDHPPIREVIGFHGREPPKSLASYILDFQQNLNLPTSDFTYLASSNGLIWIQINVPSTKNRPCYHKSFVGNPVLRQWVEIPPPPEPCQATGLVTRVEDDGVVSSFKLVKTRQRIDTKPNVWRVYVYSSETRNWTLKLILSPHPFDDDADFKSPLNLDGVLYLRKRRWGTGERGALIGHDFYGPDADVQCRVIPFPFPHNKEARRCLTTSRRHVMYMDILHRRLNVWRLNNNNSASEGQVWHLLREEINMASVGFDGICYPVAMNPFDAGIVYLWSLKHNSMVFGNLRTHKITLQKEPEYSSSEGCYSIINTSNFILDIRPFIEGRILWVANVSHFVLPWMDSVPRLGGTF
ncbi:unnamed protein product [Microthlaspi erraticum]|uniref:F-box domain-containing protein n=1 Tax=Microthlaspi erraticum TaxID=1685480 RepID=A0A6D2IBY9_9BRAS|nr:unnamed protein product [Microthlaspi erraticum]